MEHNNISRMGIWGFGVVGKAALTYLRNEGYSVGVMDRRPLADSEQALLSAHQAPFYDQKQATQFFQDFPQVLVSPGIDVRSFEGHATWVSELDLVYQHTRIPIIAITGTLGKTTTTALLAHTLAYAGKKVWTGGNIGIGALELLSDATPYDYILLEVSSFQLDLCRRFAPHIALWLNFHENHLDRHGTVANYFAAKQKIFAQQQATDIAIVPETLRPQVTTSARLVTLQPDLVDLPQLAHVTYAENLAAVATVLQALGLDPAILVEAAKTFIRDEHRLELVAQHRGVTLYNDSKSTVPQATLAAVAQLKGKPLILLLGGVSKGVDRAPFVARLAGSVKKIICFGAEAEMLHAAAAHASISSTATSTLADAITQAFACAEPGDQILFSPAGASFDLFANYQERGQRFKELIAQLTKE